MRGACVLVLVVAAACAADDGATGDDPVAPVETPATSAEPAPTDQVVTPATEAEEVSASELACGLLTPEEVEEATGLAVAEVREEPPIACVFDLGEDAGVEVFTSVDDGAGRIAGPENLYREYLLLEADGEAELVAGRGDGAVYSPQFRALAVDAGEQRFFAVGVSGGFQVLAEPRDAMVDLAATAIDRL